MLDNYKGLNPTVKTIMWSRLEGNGMEYCEISMHPATALKGQVVAEINGRPIAVSYGIQCGDDGATQSVDVSSRMDGMEQERSIVRSTEDTWYFNGQEVSEFDGLKDVDLGITPSTNTLPIRRLNLSPGESREFTAVWLKFPDLTLAPLAQRYTRIDTATYLYESIKSGYRAKIHVDPDAVVMIYEGEWERVSGT